MSSSSSYRIAVVRPTGYRHSEAFREVSETLHHGLRRLGKPVTTADNQVLADGINILLGAHLLKAAQFEGLPPSTIIYNFEQVCDESLMISAEYLEGLQKFTTWDYSQQNIERLQRAGCSLRSRHVSLGYVPELTRIEPAPLQDIDVLFYGSINDRRKRLLDQLQREGVRVHAAFGVYGAERDALIARSKVVLNVHYYPSSIFEVVRVSYLLANHKAVVSECHDGTEIDPDLREAVRSADYQGLVPACIELLQDDERRQELEKRGFECMAARDESAILAQALGIGTPRAGTSAA